MMMTSTMTQGRMKTIDDRQGPRRRPFGSVRSRLVGAGILLLAITLGLSALAVRQVLLIRAQERIDDELVQETEEFRGIADGLDPRTGKPFDGGVQRIFTVYLQANIPAPGEVFLTVPRRAIPRFLPTAKSSDLGRVFVAAGDVPRWRELESAESGELDTARGSVRYAATPVIRDGETIGTFVVGVFTASELRGVADSVRVIAIVGAGALLLGALLAFIGAGRVLAPLRRFSEATREITVSDLHRRVPVEGGEELSTLARTFNGMMNRLELAFGFQREFLRDVSHELRTPISVVRGHLELLLEEETPPDPETIRLLTGELDRMSRFVEELLLLAKAESPEFLQLETVRLDDLCGELIANAEAMAERDWVLTTSPRRSIVADRQRLTQAVMNLVQNAIAHTSDGDRIELGSSVEGEHALIWVADTGPGVDAADREMIFDRFSRGMKGIGRYEGTGLGLAIVKAIAEAHGGSVRLADPVPGGGGARFEIDLPVDSALELARLAVEEAG